MTENNLHIENESYLAQWIVGDISDTQLKKYISEEDFLAYKSLQEGLNLHDNLEVSLDDTFEAIQQRIQKKKNTTNRNRYTKWAVSIAASFVLFFGLYNSFTDNTTLIETSFAQQKMITLLDGSEVVLNAKSGIEYNENNWESNREVRLSGEAFFKVKKGSTFTVVTDNGSVKVLGTQFNVNSTDDYFSVTCFEGKVKVSNNNANYILTPTNTFRRINGDPIEKGNVNLTLPTWLSGESSFKSTPLKYVILALEKQYNLDFDSSKVDESLLFTGSFSHENLSIALVSVFRTMGIQYTKKGNKVIELNQN